MTGRRAGNAVSTYTDTLGNFVVTSGRPLNPSARLPSPTAGSALTIEDLGSSSTLVAAVEGPRGASAGPLLQRSSVLQRTGTPDWLGLAGERFTCVERLGEGSEGDVWRAFDRDLGRFVAVKRAHSQDVTRFASEVRIAGALEHPAIVALHDVGIDAAGHPYVVMRLVEGKSLEQIIDDLAAGDPEAHAVY